MIPEEQQVIDALAAAIARIDEVLNPWGFVFETDEVDYLHHGYYASGFYCRGMTRIYISAQAKFNGVSYEHTFIKEFVWHKEKERCILGHNELMKSLGHADDCQLIVRNEYPDSIGARHGGDPVAALVHDLRDIAAPVLREPCEEFFTIIRRGSLGWRIAWPN